MSHRVSHGSAPPVDLRLVPAALTAWAVTAAGILLDVGPLLAGCCLGGGAAFWVAARRRPALRAVAVGVVGTAAVGAGFAFAAGLRSDAVHDHPAGAWFGATEWVTVMPTDSPRPLSGGRVMLHANLTHLDDRDIGGRVVVFATGPDFATLSPGETARFRARLTRPRRRDLSVATLSATGRPAVGEASAIARAAESVRARFTAAAREVLPDDQSAMLPGLVLGDTTAVAPPTTADFRAAGLTHLTAVSGANVTIVCGAVLLGAGLIGPRIAVILAAAALAGFVTVVQPGASVLRAALMGSIALIGVLSSRRRQAVPALSASVIALMVLAPHLAVDAGFALSVSATAALVLIAPRWSAALTARGWPKPVADAAAVALAAHLVTAPLLAAISGRLSLVSVFANLLVAPVIPPITVLGTGAAALCSVWPAAGGALIRFTGPELWWLLTVARCAARLPGAVIAVPAGWAGLLAVGGGFLAAVGLWHRGHRAAQRRAVGGP